MSLIYKSNNNKWIILFGFLLNIIVHIQGQYGQIAGRWIVSYGDDGTILNSNNELRLQQNAEQTLSLSIYDVDMFSTLECKCYFQLVIEDTKIATIEYHKIEMNEFNLNGEWNGSLQLYTHHMGYTSATVRLYEVNDDGTLTYEESQEDLYLIVFRDQHVNDKVFTYTATALILFMFINLGTVLDLARLKTILLRPIGVLIAFCCRYIVMPGLGLGFGYLYFPKRIEYQIALFFTALAPSGGIANICNIFLKGNLNLSIASTTINSLLALAMLPLWLNMFGSLIYEDYDLIIPYVDLTIGVIAIIAAIAFGIFLRICIPKTTRLIFKFLKPLSILFSLALIIVTVVINSYVFQDVTWMIFLATFTLPIAGYLVSFVISKLLGRTRTDTLTIAIETCILNMTIPILLIQYSFENPMCDMLTVIPIMAGLISIVLVIIYYIVRRLLHWNVKLDADAFDGNKLTNEQL